MQELLGEYRSKGDRVLYLQEFMVKCSIFSPFFPLLTLHSASQEMMDAVRAAGWTRFRPVKGQPIAEKDMRKIFKLVDLDKDGTISGLVSITRVNLFTLLIVLLQELKLSLKYLGKRYGMSDVS